MGISPELADFIKANCPEYADLGEEELMMIQASFFRDPGNQNLGSANFNSSRDAASCASDEALARALQDEFSNIDINYDDDEALARALQAEMGLEEDYGTTSREPFPSGSYTPPTHTAGSSSIPTGVQDIDPDRMSYEELTNLGDSVGNEKKGLTVETMSQFQPFTFKGSARGANKDAEECVICCSKFEQGNKLIALPCLHQYHEECITKWLKDNKKCPVCQKDVER